MKKSKIPIGTLTALARRRAVDRGARWVITGGGIAIILCITAILVFISLEAWPLLRGARGKLSSRFEVSGVLDPEGGTRVPPPSVLAAGIEDYQEIAFFLTGDGMVTFHSLEDSKVIGVHRIAGLGDGKISAVRASIDSRRYILGTEDGTVVPLTIVFEQSFEEGDRRVLTPGVREGRPISLSDSPISQLWHYGEDNGESMTAALTGEGRIILLARSVEETLFGEGEVTEIRKDLTGLLEGLRPTLIALDEHRRNLFVAAKGGKLVHLHVAGGSDPRVISVLDATSGPEVEVTALGFLVGGRSLAVGDASGEVSVWFQTEDARSPGGRKLTFAHRLSSHGSAVTAIAAAQRNRGLLTADGSGEIFLHHVTSERKLLEFEAGEGPVRHLAFAPRSDGAVAVDSRGTFSHWSIDNPHPETTFRTLFGKVWYEGADKPEYVWQSTGSGDDFEPKLSLSPLVFGTFKGTFYALLFAVPMAVLSALCVSQFVHPSVRAVVKPSLEIMAALPSVVLGFLAGLWFAPFLESHVPAMFLIPPVLVVLTLLSMAVWKLLPQSFRAFFREGTELLLLAPVYVAGIQLCLWLNGSIEAALLGGEFSFWVYKTLGFTYDQRNSIVVGFAMGFAVIPVIFSISEDALSNVPRHLISGSLALGASRWQTALGVVLPTASPGIFSAVMIGLGRAVGETMIVLMATGNTPIMDWNIFNGFRALSANIAVEIPEAPHGGTLYRVLFLAAFLLFAVTFAVNTAAEIVRQKLRKKYGRL